MIYKTSQKYTYLQVYEQLREDIVSKAYPYGMKLPSKRILAGELGISVITVEHAYALLCDEGYIIAHERSGYYVSYREQESFPVGEHTGGVIHKQQMRETENQVFPFSVIAKTMRYVLSTYCEEIMKKCPNNGCGVLREAIAAYLARSRGIYAEPSRIVVGSGAEHLYGIIVQMLGREQVYAVEEPCYEKIESVYRANGVAYEKLSLGTDGIRSTELHRTGANVLHISPYRSFPSGVTASASKRWEYLNWAKEHGGIIIEDDFESEFSTSSKPENTLFSLTDRENVIYLNTFSMTIAPSIRMGYMVLPESLLALYHKKTGFYSCTVPVFEQYVVAELLNQGEFERHINRVRRRRRSKGSGYCSTN
jgi:GntR family transcriptional regulator/MocR family aminotransferase